MTVSFIFRVAALVLFIISALLAFGLGNVNLFTDLGIAECGFACWVASTVAP